MKRTLILSGIAASGLAAIVVLGQQASGQQVPGPRAGGPGMSGVGTIGKVAENLYRIPGAGGNSAVFVRRDGVLLVDTKLANNGPAILEQIRSVTDKPVTHIINTHTHGDHVGSNNHFPAQVEVVTHVNTAANMGKMEAFKSDAGKVGLPDRTYQDKLSLFRGKERVDLYYFGRAHTNGDTFVVFRDARVMHSGDAFASKGQPIIDANNGGSGLAYPVTFAAVAKGIKNVDRVITGHSDVFPWQDLLDFGEFTRLFAEHARASMAASKTPEQAMSEFKLPAKFQGYSLSGGRGGPAGNFTRLYEELRVAQAPPG